MLCQIVKVEVYVQVAGSEVSQCIEPDKNGRWCIWWDLRARKYKISQNHSINKQFLLHNEVSWAGIFGTIQPKENYLQPQQTFSPEMRVMDTVF